MTGRAQGDEPGCGHAWMHKRGRTQKPEKEARKHKEKNMSPGALSAKGEGKGVKRQAPA